MGGELPLITYKVIRSARKTIGIEIRSGCVVVRVPRHAGEAEINDVVGRNTSWILKHLAIDAARQEAARVAGFLTMSEIYELTMRAREVIPLRVRYFARVIGVTYGKISIRHQRSRWGSCSSKGNLNFNCLLMLAPSEVLDAVVVHELCHRKYPNHSREFYAEVLRAYPAYWQQDRWLKKEGSVLMRRMTKVQPGISLKNWPEKGSRT